LLTTKHPRGNSPVTVDERQKRGQPLKQREDALTHSSPSWADCSCFTCDEVDHSHVPSAKLGRPILLCCYDEMNRLHLFQPFSLPGYQAASGTRIPAVTEWTVLTDQWLLRVNLLILGYVMCWG